MTVKNDLKHRNFQALDLFFGLKRAITPLLSNFAPERDYQPALLVKNLSPKAQEVLAQIEAKVGGLG